MRNIQLLIEYDGSRYDGWQKQPSSPKSITIQGKLEEVLEKMENTPVEVIGAARTEAGVHAYGQVANFKTESDLKVFEIKRYLNRFLPRDIAVLEAVEVPERFHAAFLAKRFVYVYKITTGEVPSVFDRKFNYYSFKRPELGRMQQAAKLLLGTHDFKAFTDNKRLKKSTERTLYRLDVVGSNNEITITVEGDDFWPNMVRIIAGTLLECGLSAADPTEMEQLFISRDREKAGPTLEAKGLFLSEVQYI